MLKCILLSASSLAVSHEDVTDGLPLLYFSSVY